MGSTDARVGEVPQAGRPRAIGPALGFCNPEIFSVYFHAEEAQSGPGSAQARA